MLSHFLFLPYLSERSELTEQKTEPEELSVGRRRWTPSAG